MVGWVLEKEAGCKGSHCCVCEKSCPSGDEGGGSCMAQRLLIGMAKKALVLPGLSRSIALARSEPLHGGQNNIQAMIMRRSLLEWQTDQK